MAVAGKGDAGGGGADIGTRQARGLSFVDFAWLTATMDAPEATEQHPDDPTLIYAFRRIPEFGNRVLRLVYNQTKTPRHIVTVYFDRTAGGKR